MNEFSEGREPVLLVELDQPTCLLRYGETNEHGTCTADGQAKCFNTRFTTQSPDDFTLGTLTLRFCRAGEEIPEDWGYVIPSVESVSTAPTKINIGGSDRNSGPLGQRASVTVTFQDHPHSDFLVDPYVNERAYNPIKQGTFWSKWLSRNAFYQGRPIRIIEGYLGQPIEEMRTRHYVVDEIQGPDSSGRVRLIAKDILVLADNERSVAPRISNGVLDVAINNSVTTFDIANTLDGDYPSPGTVRIGDEVMTYTGSSFDDGVTTLTSVSRGTDNTEAAEHDENETVQICYRVNNVNCWDVIQELLEDYAGIDPDFIPSSDWNDEGSVWLPQFTVTTLITEPTGVDQLIGEISEQCLLYVWWDEREQEIKLKAVRPPLEVPKNLNDNSHIIQDSVSLSVDYDQRVSQLWIFYLPRNPTASLTQSNNFRRLTVRLDTDAETDEQYGDARIKRIFSRWLETGAQVDNLALRLLGRLRNGAKFARLRVDAKDRDLWTGDVADVVTRNQVDFFGNPQSQRYSVLSAEEVVPGEVVEYVMQLFDFQADVRIGFWMAENAPDYETATEFERLQGAWWADENDELPNGDPAYVWV